MSRERIFVGRDAELKRFGEVLEEPEGQAILVVGAAGMGKSWLIDKMGAVAKNHSGLKCGWVRYEITSGDSVDAIMGRMMSDAFGAGEVVEGSFDGTALRRNQWHALLKTIVPRGEKISELVKSFAREEKRPIREQFLERLRLISGKMKTGVRAVFVIDPLEYMDKESEKCGEDWTVVVRELPDKVKFIFAQRPEDVLARYRKFARLERVKMIPGRRLGRLGEKAVDELLDRRVGETGYGISELRDGLERYGGHPYAVQGALDLLAAGTEIGKLGADPTETGVIKEQWEKVCEVGEDAMSVMEAYAILEVAVAADVADEVSGVSRKKREALLAGNVFLEKLLWREGDTSRIYHDLLGRYIVGQIGEGERKSYHCRAVGVYRGKLAQAKEEQRKADELSAVRLAEHVLAAEGGEAFVEAFVNECYGPLKRLGLLDAAIGLSERGLGVVEKGGEREAMLLGNLGLIYYTRGELGKAEEMFRKGLEIDEKIGRREGMASDYGNLGLIYKTRGELGKAEEMHLKSLEIEKELGRREGMASKYGNLGLIYRRRGELGKAEEMYKKSLAISEAQGMVELTANQYGNLGAVYAARGDKGKAREYWGEALGLYKRIGIPDMVKKVEGWIAGLE